MKKKILAIVLSLVLVCGVVCVFASCDKETDKPDTTETQAPVASDIQYF